MPTKLFYELNTEKQKKIIDIGICEFSTYGYTNSSTNRIVKNSGISKGSLFKYFSTKEDLFFFILDTVTSEFTAYIEKSIFDLSAELFQRVFDYSELEFNWYVHNPEKAKLIINSFAKADTDIYLKILERYKLKELNIYYSLLEDVDLNNLNCNKQQITEILKWFLKGFNEEFLYNIKLDECTIEKVQEEYTNTLKEYMEILKKGLLK